MSHRSMDDLLGGFDRFDEDAEGGTGEASVPGVTDSDLSPEAQRCAQAVDLSLIGPPGRRVVSVFLGIDNYQKVEEVQDELTGNLLMECLPAFVHARGGRIVRSFRIGDHHGNTVNPILRSVTVEGKVRQFVHDGFLFLHFPEERVVVSVVTTRSSKDSAGFLRAWTEYTGQHNYLRGQAFFADGEIIERKRKLGWDDIVLQEENRRLIRTHVESFLNNRKELGSLGVKARRGIILSGPPGTGKTLLGKVLADTLDVSFIWVSPRHIRSANSFASILSLARFVSPVILFLEDLDLFAGDRETRGWLGLGELMNQLDGAMDNQDIITIATTNQLEVVEKALRNRPGRFDRLLCFDEMDDRCRRLMLTRLLSRATVSEDNLAHFTAVTEHFTGAQMEEIVNTIFMLAIEDQKARGGLEPGVPPKVVVTCELIDRAVDEVRVARRGDLGFRAG